MSVPPEVDTSVVKVLIVDDQPPFRLAARTVIRRIREVTQRGLGQPGVPGIPSKRQQADDFFEDTPLTVLDGWVYVADREAHRIQVCKTELVALTGIEPVF